MCGSDRLTDQWKHVDWNTWYDTSQNRFNMRNWVYSCKSCLVVYSSCSSTNLLISSKITCSYLQLLLKHDLQIFTSNYYFPYDFTVKRSSLTWVLSLCDISIGENLRPLEGIRVLDLTRWALTEFSNLIHRCSRISDISKCFKCVQGSGWSLCHHDPGRSGSSSDQGGETRWLSVPVNLLLCFCPSVSVGSDTYYFLCVFCWTGAGDDTRAWGPPFVGTESAYFLSVNRNKKVRDALKYLWQSLFNTCRQTEDYLLYTILNTLLLSHNCIIHTAWKNARCGDR